MQGKRNLSRDIARKFRGFRNLDAVQKLEILTKLQANGHIVEKKEGRFVKYYFVFNVKTIALIKQNKIRFSGWNESSHVFKGVSTKYLAVIVGW